MKFIKIPLVAFSVIIALLWIGSFLLPSSLIVKRSITINASNKEVFNYFNELQQWRQWSPWLVDSLENDLQYSQPSYGKHAFITWQNSKHKNKGRITILSAKRYTDLHYKVDYDSFNSSYVTVHFEADKNATFIVWQLQNDINNNPVNKYAALIMPFFVGKDLEKSLRNIKRLCEEG